MSYRRFVNQRSGILQKGWAAAGLLSLLLVYAVVGHAQPRAANPVHYVEWTVPGVNDDLSNTGTNRKSVVVQGQVIVRFRPNLTRARQQQVIGGMAAGVKYFRHPLGSKSSVQKQAVAGGPSVFDQLALVQLGDGADLAQAVNHLRHQADVLYAEPNYQLHTTDTSPAPVIPNDFDFAQLWGMQNVGQGDGTAGTDISAPEAWEVTTGAKRVIVAIIDTGIDYYHPDLADNVWVNPGEVAGNGEDDDGNGYVDDVHGYDLVSDDGDPMDDLGHGTHVAGTIGAVGNNGIGIAGVCWHVSLMAVKAFDETGNGAIDTAIQGIRYAIENGAQIINASWGSNDKSRALEDVIREAHLAGLIFVAAAGNDNVETPFYPAAYDHVVGVASIDANNHRSRFSNFGTFVDVAAPGENIYSTIPNNSYTFYSGTSMAAPHVSGVAALIVAQHPEFSNDQVENILRNSVDSIAPDKYIGTGRINAAAAVRVNGPLPEVQLNLPDTIYGDVDISGVAVGDDFSGYSLEYGKGTNPTNWTSFFSSASPASDGTLFQNFPTPALDEGLYTFRLTAQNAAGGKAVERVSVQISNVHISLPLHDDILRAGDKVNIVGTVFGEGRSYKVEYGLGPQPESWSDAGVTLVSGGHGEVREGTLAVWDTAVPPPNQFYTLRLTAVAQDGTSTEFITHLLYLDSHLKPGWPQYIPVAGNYPLDDWRNLVVADLDGDGRDEIILLDHGNDDGQPAHLLVYRADGSLMWSKELAAGFPYSDIPVVGDVDGDGLMEIFVDVGSDGQLFAFRHDGTPLPGQWPVHLEAGGLGKVLADLNGDGKKELIGLSQNTVTRGSSEYRQLVVFDYQGNLLNKWEIPACDADLDAPRMLPAVGNLDADPDLEIVTVSGCGDVVAFKLGKSSGPLWTANTFGTFFASPVVADLEGTGTNQVVIGAFDLSGGNRGGVYAFTHDGKRRPGWPVLIQESFSAAPALADFDGSGRLAISIPSWKSGLLHLVRPDGFEMNGWPVGPILNSSFKTSPVIGDVDGDGQPDIVLSCPGYLSQVQSSGDFSQAGGVRAWNLAGQPIALNGVNSVMSLVMEASGGIWLKAAPPTLADIDHDGKLDIIAASIQDRTYLPPGEKSVRKNRSSIYVWSLDTPYVPERLPWPTLQANPEHTGYSPARPHPNQPPVVGQIPSQIVATGGAFFPIQLDQYVDDPDNTPKQIVWSATGNQELSIQITTNHMAILQTTDPSWAGVETVRFTATDPGGLTGQATATFEVRPGYIAPIAQSDHAVTLEDTPVEIDVLANDSDVPGNTLSIVDFSRPALGKVTKTAKGTLLYTPKRYANGSDSFTYIVTNGKGGISMGSVMIEITPVNDPPVAAPDFVVIDEDTPVDIDVLANDSDPDNDPFQLSSFTQPLNGTVVKGPDNIFHYLPSTNYFGPDSFTYTISDPHGATNQGTVSIMIKPVNDPPVAQNQSFTLNKNSSQNIIFQAIDPDDTEFTFSIVDIPQHGELWNYPKVATYYPTYGFAGSDHFTYRANDGKDDGPLATVQLTVLDVNNPPTTTDQSIVTKVDQPATLHLTATDLDNDPLTYQILSQPVAGTLSGSGTNFVYQPDLGFLGTDAFTFRASDGKDWSLPATINITVTDKNTPPEAQDFSVSVLVNTPTNITLQATDPESDPLNFHLVTRPINGKLTGKGQVLLYSPNPYFIGSDRFTFKADDGQLDSQVATVSISIDARNHPPVSTNQLVVVSAGRPTPILLAVVDQDGDSLSCPILKGPQHGRISGLGTNLTYTPQPGFLGGDTFTYKAWDGQTYSRDALVTLSVVVAPPPLSLAFQSVHRLADGQVRLLLTTPIGQLAEVLVSEDLVHWTLLPTGTTEGGTTSVIDMDAQKYSQRFYRARQYRSGP